VIIRGLEVFLADRDEKDKKQIKTQLDILVGYLTNDVNYSRDAFSFGPPALPDCPSCVSELASVKIMHNGNSDKALSVHSKLDLSLKLLGGHIGNSNDSTYFLSCEKNPTHLFALRLIM